MSYDFCHLKDVEGRLCRITTGINDLNHGGLLEAFFVADAHILQLPNYRFTFDQLQAALLDGDILLKPGASVYQFRFSSGTGSFSEVMNETDAGIFYDKLFTLKIPKDRPELTFLKHSMRKGRYTVFYRDGNGMPKVFTNVRVKFDLSTGTSKADYNGHTLSARRADSYPVLHYNAPAAASISDIFSVAVITYDYIRYPMTSGWQAGHSITLPYLPVSPESLFIKYNNTLLLEYGTHYTLSGHDITLLHADVPGSQLSGELQIFYAASAAGTAVSTFNQEVSSKTASYASGETIVLSSAPISSAHLIVEFNDTLQLRYGTDYLLNGASVEILFDGSPSVSSPDTFNFYYLTSGPAANITGWKQYKIDIPSVQPINSIFQLPHTPIQNSLILTQDDTFTLRPGVHYNLNNNEIENLFELPAGSTLTAWYAYT